MKISANTKATPPVMFIHKARVAFFTEVSSPSWEMSMKEQNVVISQKKYSQSRLLASTRPFIAPRNATRKKKNLGCLDLGRRRCSSWVGM